MTDLGLKRSNHADSTSVFYVFWKGMAEVFSYAM